MLAKRLNSSLTTSTGPLSPAGLAGAFGSIGFSGVAGVPGFSPGVPGVPGFVPGVTEPLGLNTYRRFPVAGSTFVPTSSYPGTSPAGLLPSANGFNGLPFTSTHTVEGLSDVVGLKMCVTFPVSGFVIDPTNS